MIRDLELKNFTVFEDLKICFSPKINLIIGENGTGKTHLLKAAYVLSSQQPVLEKSELKEFLTQRLIRTFLPFENKLGKIHLTGARTKAELKGDFVDFSLALSFHNNSQSVVIHQNGEGATTQSLAKPVFFPVKETLSFMEGMVSLYDTYEMTFDETYRHVWTLLQLPPLRPENIQGKVAWAIEEIETICGGEFIFHGGGRVTFRPTQKAEEYSVNAIAEGFRKIGTLARLLKTGSIQPGGSGPLFWDEPEGNMNPKLMRILVEILLELARNGQQIIIATHDSVLLQWFNLLSDKGKGDHIIYHTLYKDDSNQVKLNSTDHYLEINPNPIDDTFEDLINSELEQSMGSLGK